MKLQQIIEKDQSLTKFIQNLTAKTRSLLTGVNRGALCLLLEQILTQRHNVLFIVEETENKAQLLYQSLSGVVPDDQRYLFLVEADLALAKATVSPDVMSDRIKTLMFLMTKKPGIVITTPQGLQYPLTPPARYAAAEKELSIGQTEDLAALQVWLVQNGYEKQTLVARPGEFALRGDILDVYTLTRSDPIRVEFFGDEIDTIKTFDVANQRSLAAVKRVVISPASDRLLTKKALQEGGKALGKQLNAQADDLLKKKFGESISLLQQGVLNDRSDLLTAYLLKSSVSLPAYGQADAVLIYDDWPRLKKNVAQVDQDNADLWKTQGDDKLFGPMTRCRLSFEKVIRQSELPQLYLSIFQKGMGRLRFDQLLNWPTRVAPQFFSQMPLLTTQLKTFNKEKQTVILQADRPQRAKQISQTLIDFGLDVPITDFSHLSVQMPQICVGHYPEGFVLPNIDLVYLTERELFNEAPHKPKANPTFENAQRLRRYTDLKPGDYVVHVNHGIGRFEGIKTMTVDGKKRDYITITYRHHDQLFVPADQLRLVQKYTASEGHRPSLNQLGGSEWAKTKRRVAAKVEDIADELVALYAKREAEKGFAFSPDDDLQQRFEDAFPYVETPDQLKTIQEIKADMEKTRPMDRLVVGDVGFGKTEVALRAAFKAIQDDKQVAFLVPTTILAQQHYETMQDRFKDFPIEFAQLSRFQSHQEAKAITKDLADGKIDLVVGTHRLLSKDVHFKDLGLLIVDEEQRFGVKHKEKLKQLKANVDVLTLTATPIPRTLHMSMVGARDLSLMETPPSNRFPIQTYVMEQLDDVVRQACLREMARNGQIFYLHNRIDDIDQVVERLQKLIPEAHIGYIHGRMSENELEDMLYRFLNRDFDLLVTTTIIETGIDMPNVNTMIIEDADRYGLSQLYQLRGRIGRSARLAYAYFLYKPNKVLTEVGEKRLEAIRDFTQLGSGFKIAMRDLAIRGAGNMLGKQQHGFIDSVGYDLYTQMLEDAVKDKQGHKAAVKSNAEIDLGQEAYLPSDYIPDQTQKIEFYKKIKAIASPQDLANVQDELLDRFGDYPAAVENLLAAAQLKTLADLAQVLTLTYDGHRVYVQFNHAGTREMTGPNVFKALEHVDFKAQIETDAQKRLTVWLKVPEKFKMRQLVNELSLFLRSAGEIIQR